MPTPDTTAPEGLSVRERINRFEDADDERQAAALTPEAPPAAGGERESVSNAPPAHQLPPEDVPHDEACPECGGLLTELAGGDGGTDQPTVGVACIDCDFVHYDGDEWPTPAAPVDAGQRTPEPCTECAPVLRLFTAPDTRYADYPRWYWENRGRCPGCGADVNQRTHPAPAPLGDGDARALARALLADALDRRAEVLQGWTNQGGAIDALTLTGLPDVMRGSRGPEPRVAAQRFACVVEGCYEEATKGDDGRWRCTAGHERGTSVPIRARATLSAGRGTGGDDAGAREVAP